MKKFIKKGFFFLIGYLVVVQIINYFAPYHWGNPWYSSKIQYLENNHLEKKYNLFFFGSSRVYRQIDPSVVDQVLKKSEMEINSFNLGSPATFSPQNLYLYENFLESDLSKNAKYAVIELASIDGIGTKRLHEERTYYYQNFSDLLYIFDSYNANDELFKKKNIEIYFRYLISLFEKNILPANFKHTLIDDNFYKKTYLGQKKDGYFSLDKELTTSKDSVYKEYLYKRKNGLSSQNIELRKNIDLKTYSESDLKNNKTNIVDLTRINNLIELSNNKGIHLIFMISSRATTKELMALGNKIPKSNFIDMANPDEFPFIYSLNDSFDVGHLNEKGAVKYSRALANKIEQIIN